MTVLTRNVIFLREAQSMAEASISKTCTGNTRHNNVMAYV